MAPIPFKKSKVESLLGFLDQYDWEGLFDMKGIPIQYRDAYRVRAEAMHKYKRKILEAITNPTKAIQIGNWKRELQALSITDPMEYESFEHWRKAVLTGEHAHHRRGGVNVLQNVGKLPNAAQYDLHKALKEGYDEVIGQPKSKGPLILSNWMHKGSKSVPPWEVGSVMRSAHRGGTSGFGPFGLSIGSSGDSLARQVIQNTGHYADWDEEAWQAYKASHDYIRQSGLEGKPLSQLSQAVTDSQATQRLFASERGISDLPTSTTAATGAEKLANGTKVAKGTDIVTTGGNRFIHKAGKWLQVLGDAPPLVKVLVPGLTIASIVGDSVQAAQTAKEIQQQGLKDKHKMQIASIVTGIGSLAFPPLAIPSLMLGLGTTTEEGKEPKTEPTEPLERFIKGYESGEEVSPKDSQKLQDARAFKAGGGYAAVSGGMTRKQVIELGQGNLRVKDRGIQQRADKSGMSFLEQELYEAGGGKKKQGDNRLSMQQVMEIGQKNLNVQDEQLRLNYLF